MKNKDLNFPNLKLNIQLQKSRQWDTVMWIATWINAIELRVKKQTFIFMTNWFSTKVPIQLNGGKYSLVSKWFGNNWIYICKIKKLSYCLTPYTKTNSKSIKDLSIKAKPIQFSEGNLGINLYDLELCNNS